MPYFVKLCCKVTKKYGKNEFFFIFSFENQIFFVTLHSHLRKIDLKAQKLVKVRGSIR